MTLRPDLIRGGIIAKLKASSTITDELLSPGADEIRQSQWQGREFSYPCVRVFIGTITPMQPDCNRWEIEFSIGIFSEEASSYQADRISGIIHEVLHSKSFSQTVQSQDLRFSLWTNSIVPAIRRDEKTWRSELLMRATVSG